LNDTKKWHSHGRGISMSELTNDVKVEIDDLENFGGSKDLHERTRAYDALLFDYMSKLNQRGVIHTKGNYTPFM
jgi:hypothetical protein